MSAETAKAPVATPANPAPDDIASLQVSLPQMLDLALGTPEVGVVNLNILHHFLHILLHQINLRTTKVEYRGEDANRIKTMVSSLKAGPSLHLQEYSIISGANDVKQRVQNDESASLNVDVVVDGTNKSTQEDADLKTAKGTRQKISPGVNGEPETVIYVEPLVDGSTPTALGFKRLEQSVNELRHQFHVLEELATTPELVERVKGKVTDPVTDVWQIINITKRLDATEQGIDKLTKMMQDVMKGDISFEGEETSQLDDRLANVETDLENLNRIVKNLQIISDSAEDNGEEILLQEAPVTAKENGQPTQRVSLTQLLGGIDVKQMNQDVATLQGQVTQMKEELQNLNIKIHKSKSEHELSKKSQVDIDASAEETEPEEKSEKHAEGVKETPKETKPAPKDPSKEKQVESTPRKSTSEAVEGADAIDSEQLQEMRERIGKLEKDVSCLFEKVESAPMAGVSGNAELDDLVSKIQGIQIDMDKLNQTADHLIDDQENREIHLNALLEQVELLKTIKADREDLEDALADKADAQAITRKVSYDQFDAACDDLAQGLEDAINKLGKQESIWQQAMDEVQREIEGKVDKMEMTPLKDFVSAKLKSLQEKVKNVAQMRQESEAAGTKKLLKDVQCISCDKNVVMKMEDSHRFRSETLPCTGSMKPYLTYELDQVRKQHRRLPHSRNMLQFEAALQEDAKKQRSAKADTLVKTPRDHLCNRYCGGSHTVTTPQQRVMRVGHFLTQWGPEIIQLTEGMIKGTDGKMYKSRPMPGKFDVCGPGYCQDRGDEIRLSMKVPSTPQEQRKISEKQSNGRKKTSRRSSRELTSEVIEELAETPRERDRNASEFATYETSDRGVRYMNEDDMEDLE
ncbi:glutamine-rich protein 2-like [Osmia bicornis bicornis]|uniref:glutamine-rich protein 2-like n=1 Tax=Osmia bicornis bicornis TaxID=1437191 RepID=UPI001EAF87F9|nr:glutamine-rich protein 2-like [Osmia bicornis bicornis]